MQEIKELNCCIISVDKLPELLQYWQSWKHLRPEKLYVDVGDHGFSVHTCTRQIDVPKDMPAADLKAAILSGLEVGGFGSV